MEKFDYLVVGSGLYGSIFAHEAKAHGKSVLVVDKRPNIAGNIYTENIEGIVNKKIVEKETSEQCFDAVEATRNML